MQGVKGRGGDIHLLFLTQRYFFEMALRGLLPNKYIDNNNSKHIKTNSVNHNNINKKKFDVNNNIEKST